MVTETLSQNSFKYFVKRSLCSDIHYDYKVIISVLFLMRGFGYVHVCVFTVRCNNMLLLYRYSKAYLYIQIMKFMFDV